MLTRYQDRAAGSHGFGTPGRTRLRSNRTGLQDLTRSDQQFQHAFKVSDRRCRISRVRNTRSYMPTRYQDGAAGSQGFGITVQHTYEVHVSGRGCRISRVRNIRSNLSGWGCRISQVGNSRSYMLTCLRTCLRGIRTGLQDLTGSEHQIVYAYEVSGRGCRISRVRNNKSNIPRRYQDEAAGSHEFRTPYRTCLEGIRTELQDLTGSEHQIVDAHEVSGRNCRFSRVRTSDRTCIWATDSTDSHELGPQSEHRISWVGTSERTCIRSCNHAPINVFPQSGGGGDTLGIRLTNQRTIGTVSLTWVLKIS